MNQTVVLDSNVNSSKNGDPFLELTINLILSSLNFVLVLYQIYSQKNHRISCVNKCCDAFHYSESDSGTQSK